MWNLSAVLALALSPLALDEADPAVSVHRPVVSPNGKQLVFMASSPGTGGDWELFRAGLDGRGLTRLTESPGWDGYPVFSPDGERVIFDRSLAGNGDDKTPFFLDLATGATRRLGQFEGWVSICAWRGERLLASWEQEGQRDLYLLGLDGGVLRRLTDTAARREGDACFAPDGQRVAFASSAAEGQEGGGALELIELESGARRTLFETAGRVYGVDWSPAGGRLAFTHVPAGEEADADVLIFDLESGAISPVTTDDAWDHMPVWMPAGEGLLFTSYRAGAEQVFLALPSGPIVRVWTGVE